ncbi:unnamed protein product [Mytilus coruscus]|uniref:Endonuclease/exonuclease/phosphatase domain-containing protein n=1 Tax=Mytilus coruscus TaxID=42192 RepID=A0A6J8AL29_MYTCO|nr:unnamed protein product [Mytilus coruscus]
MNASLHRDNRRRDKVFEEFKNINNLHIPDSYPIKSTFFHHNGKYTSKLIIFCLMKKIIQQLKPAVKIATRHPTNTSDHKLVTANMAINVKKITIYNIQNNVESRIQKLESVLHKAGMKSIPRYRKLKTLKPVDKGIWNSKISQASTEAKSAHKSWKDKTLKSGCGFRKAKSQKQKTLSATITETPHASKKEKFINEIMQASEKDRKTFHKFI